MITQAKTRWYIRDQATQRRFTESVYPSRAQAEGAITTILSETKKRQQVSPCLEAVQLLTEG